MIWVFFYEYVLRNLSQSGTIVLLRSPITIVSLLVGFLVYISICHLNSVSSHVLSEYKVSGNDRVSKWVPCFHSSRLPYSLRVVSGWWWWLVCFRYLYFSIPVSPEIIYSITYIIQLLLSHYLVLHLASEWWLHVAEVSTLVIRCAAVRKNCSRMPVATVYVDYCRLTPEYHYSILGFTIARASAWSTAAGAARRDIAWGRIFLFTTFY